MPRPPSANSILKNIKKQRFEPKNPIASDMFLPNNSGVKGYLDYKSLALWQKFNNGIFYNDGNVGIGTLIPTEILEIVKDENSEVTCQIKNVNTGNSAIARFRVENSLGGGGFGILGENYSLASQIANHVIIISEPNTDGLAIVAQDTDGIISFYTGGIASGNERMRIDKDGKMTFIGAGTGLPFGEINRISNATETTITNQNVYEQITIFDTDGENNNTTPDHTNDHITITKAGRYLITCSITLNSVGGAGSTAEMEVKKNNGNVRVGALHVDRTLAGGGAEASAETMTGLANLSVNDTIEVWIKNETNTQNYIVEDITLSLVQLGG